ncbi:MAG: type I methionyl aminopeptidase [Bacteroidota bacterium]
MIHLKSDSEIAIMRRAADLVSRTLAEVGRHIQPGVSTAELDAIAEDFIRSAGAVPAFKGYAPSKKMDPFPATLCTSINDAVVHGIPSEDDVLQDGDLLSVDCGVVLEGYLGDSAFTFGVGTISDEDRALCVATYESLMAGVAQAVAGRRLGDIGHAVQARCEPAGYGVVRDLCGHGVGRSLWEEPQVPNYGRRGSGRKLKKGLTICIEPMINRGTADVHTDADGWTVRTDDGARSAHYELTVAVQKGQPDVLSTFAYIEDVVAVPYAPVPAPDPS